MCEYMEEQESLISREKMYREDPVGRQAVGTALFMSLAFYAFVAEAPEQNTNSSSDGLEAKVSKIDVESDSVSSAERLPLRIDMFKDNSYLPGTVDNSEYSDSDEYEQENYEHGEGVVDPYFNE